MITEISVRPDETAFLKKERRQGEKLASAWVEMDECLRFPVAVRAFKDKAGKEKMFVSYPKQKDGDGYADVIAPSDGEVRKEIESAVLKAMAERISKLAAGSAPVTDIRITLPAEKEYPAEAEAVAAGMRITGITITGDGHGGYSVIMPPSLDASAVLRVDIHYAVLEAYELERRKAREAPFVQKYLECMQRRDAEGILALLAEAKAGNAGTGENGAYREASLTDGENTVTYVLRHKEKEGHAVTSICAELSAGENDKKTAVSLVKLEADDRETAEKNIRQASAVWDLFRGRNENVPDRKKKPELKSIRI